jgi:hypothetical protein
MKLKNSVLALIFLSFPAFASEMRGVGTMLFGMPIVFTTLFIIFVISIKEAVGDAAYIVASLALVVAIFTALLLIDDSIGLFKSVAGSKGQVYYAALVANFIFYYRVSIKNKKNGKISNEQ